MSQRTTVSVLLPPGSAEAALVRDVRQGLGSPPLTLPPKWLYDDEGSRLFDQITRLPEYYPTEAEREVLLARADEIARLSGATTLVELGSGTSDKTHALLRAFKAAGQLRRFVPVDVSEGTLRGAAEQVAAMYDVPVEAVVGDFTLHLSHLPRGDRKLVAFLGGTIGNLYIEERNAFLGALADSLEPGDGLLLGTDLVKDADRLISAYDDPEGVTDRFVRNGLRVLNRELGADFDLGGFTYVPFWDPHLQRMDLRLRAETPMHVRIPGAGIELQLHSGEEVRMEISTKFTVPGIRDELDAVGLALVETWTDAAGEFAVTLARKEG
jgi:L-histidine N-alpha-methyltransferase